MEPERTALTALEPQCAASGLRSIDLHWHASLPSTMDVASALAATGPPRCGGGGADEQTAGRGRRGHEWQSPPGAGLYFSMVARPSLGRHVAAAADACGRCRRARGHPRGDRPGGRSEVAERCDDRPAQARRHPGGRLGPRHPRAGGDDRRRRECSAGGVSARCGRTRDVARRRIRARRSIAARCSARCSRGLWRRLAALERKRGDILQAWRAASPSAVGTRVEWDMKHGITAGIDDDGALLVEHVSGVERIIAGELHWNL